MAEAQRDYLAGYLIFPTGSKVDKSFDAGFSIFSTVWPLVNRYPGHRFQTGLPGTWMFAKYDGKAPENLYSDVEGGLGWWTDTRFPTETPKFIMGGVGPNFSAIANGPGHGAGTWDEPRGLYGVAQLTPWLLFPPDGLNLKKGTCGQRFGYGYLSLPLTEAKSTTDGKPVPTGSNCWTLFLSSNNFKGPVAFFTPHFWSHTTVAQPRLAGQLLDSRPSDPNTALEMETQYIPCQIRKDSRGESYARIAPTSFPLNVGNDSALMGPCTAYRRSALTDAVEAWFNGGPPASGAISPAGSYVRDLKGSGYSTWEIRTPGPDGKELKVPIDWQAFATFTHLTRETVGLKWNLDQDLRVGSLATIPEYFHLQKDSLGKKWVWAPVRGTIVPPETGLALIKWARPREEPQLAYTTPEALDGAWKKPGPIAGPFRAHLADGTVVTYYWYRFADQPALLNSDLTKEEREKMQKRVELLHRAWPKTRNYLNPPKGAKLADLDSALIVKPPKGLEVGYVPIAARQELERR